MSLRKKLLKVLQQKAFITFSGKTLSSTAYLNSGNLISFPFWLRYFQQTKLKLFIIRVCTNFHQNLHKISTGLARTKIPLNIYILLHGIEVSRFHHEFRSVISDALIQSLLQALTEVILIGVQAGTDCQLDGQDNRQKASVLWKFFINLTIPILSDFLTKYNRDDCALTVQQQASVPTNKMIRPMPTRTIWKGKRRWNKAIVTRSFTYLKCVRIVGRELHVTMQFNLNPNSWA